MLEACASPGLFLAHGWLQLQTQARWYFSIGVHPVWRRHGLGSALFGFILERARELKAQQLAAYIRSDQQAAHSFLAHHGFKEMGHNRFMKATPSLTREPPGWPEGFRVRTLAETGDLTLLVEAHNLCYSSLWGHYENSAALTVEKLQEFMQAYPDSFIPEGIFMLFSPSGEIAGLSYGRLSTPADSQVAKARIVDSPGVAPKFRHHGLLRPLALLTLQWLHGQGEGPIELECFGEEESTVALYQELGFALDPKDHWIEWMRPVE